MFVDVMQRATILLIASLLLLVGWNASTATSNEVGAADAIEAAAQTTLDPESEELLLNELNRVRAENGLDPLQRDPGLDAIALDWTNEMAPQGILVHRDDLVDQVSTRLTNDWMRVGENIGWGPSASWLHNGFWNSPPHRANMLGDYNRVGLGALREADGDVWVTVNFLKGPDLPAPPTAQPTAVVAADAWAVTPDGEVTALGDAPHLGDPSHLTLQRPIVGLTATASGDGYWLVASDGGIFTYGDAAFHGSTGAIALNQPIVGMATTPSGEGYWLVAADGGIFTFGDAAFHGSTGALSLNQPIVGMTPTPTGGGYWLVASDGGIFAFGDARFQGSTGALVLDDPIVGMATSPTGLGYWLVDDEGAVFAFGDAAHRGGAEALDGRVVGITPGGDVADYWIYLADGRAVSLGVEGAGVTPVLDSSERLASVAVRHR